MPQIQALSCLNRGHARQLRQVQFTKRTTVTNGIPHCRQICDSESLRLQQIAAAFNERLATGSISISYEQQIPTGFNTRWNLVRDQGVGGSNPLSPTNLFNNLEFRKLSQVSPWCGFRGCPSASVGFKRDLRLWQPVVGAPNRGTDKNLTHGKSWRRAGKMRLGCRLAATRLGR